MQPKPRGLERRHAEQFCDGTVVDAYTTRPPYPRILDPLFVELAGGRGARILDLGCGTGELTRRLAPRVAAITAIDQSAPMIAQARALAGGDAANIDWIVGRIEDATLAGPFSSALAAESFHWFDWGALRTPLTAWVPSRRLILCERREVGSAWSAELSALIARFSTNRDFEPFDVVHELTARRYLRVEGSLTLPPEPFVQSIEDYVTSLHSRNGLSRERMPAADARTFDAGVRQAVTPHATDSAVTLWIEARVVWGCLADPA